MNSSGAPRLASPISCENWANCGSANRGTCPSSSWQTSLKQREKREKSVSKHNMNNSISFSCKLWSFFIFHRTEEHNFKVKIKQSSELCFHTLWDQRSLPYIRHVSISLVTQYDSITLQHYWALIKAESLCKFHTPGLTSNVLTALGCAEMWTQHLSTNQLMT